MGATTPMPDADWITVVFDAASVVYGALVSAWFTRVAVVDPTVGAEAVPPAMPASTWPSTSAIRRVTRAPNVLLPPRPMRIASDGQNDPFG